MDIKLNWEPSESDYGVLWPYINDDNITDIDFSARQLWVTHLIDGRYDVKDHKLTDSFVEKFSHLIGNRANKPFNKQNPVLEAQTNDLRITIVHESRSISGRCICIRKSKREVRMTKELMVRTNYCTEEIINLIANCVKAKMNIAFCGEPGVGKTECAKFFSSIIPKNERVITIEDTAEWHYGEINPGSDFVELLVDQEDIFDYTSAIKTCLRLNPKWIMLSEARSTEVKYLLEQWSTGVHGFTTLHLDDLYKLSDRILNMYGDNNDSARLENNVYEFVNVGILIRKKLVDGKPVRYIDQVGFYYRENNMNKITLILEDGKRTKNELPEIFLKKFSFANIDKEKIFM